MAEELTWNRSQKITDQQMVSTARGCREVADKKGRWVSEGQKSDGSGVSGSLGFWYSKRFKEGLQRI